MYSVTEAAEKTGLKDYQLRTYEEKLGISIARNDQGHRIYSEEDIALLIQIRALKSQGLTLELIKQQLFPNEADLGEGEKNQEIQATKLPELRGEDLLQIWKEQQQSFAKEFLAEIRSNIREEVAATIREDLKDELIMEVRSEFARQDEQRETENKKLLLAIQGLREKPEDKKKKFIFW